MRSFLLAIFFGAIIFSADASAGLFDSLDSLFGLSEKRLKTYDESKDKELVNSFYTLTDDGKTQSVSQDLLDSGFSRPRLTQYSISIEKDMFKDSNMGEMLHDMNNYTYDSSSDAAAVKYMLLVKGRGNTIRLFKLKLADTINHIFTQPFSPGPHTAQWYGVDNALIEYNPSGAIVSFMTRAHQAMTTIGVNSTLYTTIYFGQDTARLLENKVRNSDFQDSIIRDL